MSSCLTDQRLTYDASPSSEHYSTSRHAQGFYRGIATTCQYVVKENQYAPPQTLVEQAVARLVLRLGGLRVAITGEDTNHASFVQVPSMDLRDCIEWKTLSAADLAQYDQGVLQVMKGRLEQLWPEIATRPPWKLLVVQNQEHLWPSHQHCFVLDFVFATHHALADGKSTTIFHTELLRELNTPAPSPSPELENHVLTFHNAPVLAPSQEDLVDLSISWPFLLKTLWTAFAPAWLKPSPPPNPWTGNPITLEPNILRLRLVTLPADAVVSLVAACRAHQTTLSGLFHVLLLTSVARRLPADDAVSPLAGETAISLLPWANLPSGDSRLSSINLKRVLTDLATGTSQLWDAATVAQLRDPQTNSIAEETVVWPLAKEWRDNIKAKIATLPNDDYVGLLRYVDFKTYWLDKIGKPRSGTWELSNIGTIKPDGGVTDGRGEWTIQRSLFTQPVKVAGSAITINVTGVDGGPVNLVLSWQETVVDDVLVDGVVKDLRAWFGRFAKSGTFGIFTNAA